MDSVRHNIERSFPNSGAGAAPGRVPTLLLATACGVVAANIYYLQPLAALVATSTGMAKGASGLIATMTQIGYGVGLVLVVPLGDLVENRRLVLSVLGVAVAALLAAGASTNAAMLLPAALLVGLGAVAVQLIVVYAAHLAAKEQQGRVIGMVTSGLMLGITFARPAAGVVAQVSSWRTMMVVAAALTAAIALRLMVALPRRHRPSSETYAGMMARLPGLFLHSRVIRWRTFVHANLFFGFAAFWTVVPLVLRDRFHLSEGGIALYSLTGFASVLAAPVAGWAADRTLNRSGTATAVLGVAAGFALAIAAAAGWSGVALLVAAAILIGAGVTAHAVFAQRDVFALDPGVRARLNGLFMAAYFSAGALGSAAASWAYVAWGWRAACTLGLAASAVALIRLLFPAPASPSQFPKEHRS
ncbi:MFS transporter [Azospirillum sp. ST 5-10]|uniref:MFS transporter n=1 Tax=unclassified Azospirillum TaxID=2630922 RepID=UPI003F4A1DCC